MCTMTVPTSVFTGCMLSDSLVFSPVPNKSVADRASIIVKCVVSLNHEREALDFLSVGLST